MVMKLMYMKDWSLPQMCKNHTRHHMFCSYKQALIEI